MDDLSELGIEIERTIDELVDRLWTEGFNVAEPTQQPSETTETATTAVSASDYSDTDYLPDEYSYADPDPNDTSIPDSYIPEIVVADPYDPSYLDPDHRDPDSSIPGFDNAAGPTNPVDLPATAPDRTAVPSDDEEDLYSTGESFLDQRPIDDLPFADAQEIYESFDAIGGLQTRQDVSDDLQVEHLDPGQVPELTAGRTVLVIDALAEIGAFRRVDDPLVTQTVRSIRDVIPSDGLSANGYRAEIRRFSVDLRPALELLEADGVVVSPALKQMSTSLDPDLLDALASGETSIIDPNPWLNGLSDLVIRDGAAPRPPATRSANRPAVMAAVAAVAGIEFERLAPGDPDSDGPDDIVAGRGQATDSGWLASGFIAAVVALLVALAVLRRRTVPGAVTVGDLAPPKLSITDLLDASRRMTASLDVDEIGPIVMAETRRLVAAEGCIIALREGKGLTALHHEPAELFEPDVLSDPEAAESCLRRVVETGQATVMIASDEPVLVEVPMALIAVPIVVDGQVAGAMLIVRVSARPFGREDVEALEMLAPMVGTALQSAKTHGSATALAETEPLTGLKNRRRLAQDLSSLDEEPVVAYIMIDVDHFKTFNDTNGHAAGDEALRRVARVLEASVRPGDLVYRYGGEEFCMLLPNVTDEGAMIVAERVRHAVETAAIPGGESQPGGRVTVSVGIACDGPAEALVERADAALYLAKREGRNQVRLAEHV